MINKTAQQSLLDLLFRVMPELKDQPGGPMVFLLRRPQSTVDKKAVNALMSMWKDEKNALAYRKFKRPDDLGRDKLDLLLKENLIREIGSELEVTAKGVEIIKTTILGDERSVYEDDGDHLDYEVALANTKPKRKMLKGAKRASYDVNTIDGSWYRRLKNGTDYI